jgi:hypothetical protein
MSAYIESNDFIDILEERFSNSGGERDGEVEKEDQCWKTAPLDLAAFSEQHDMS